MASRISILYSLGSRKRTRELDRRHVVIIILETSILLLAFLGTPSIIRASTHVLPRTRLAYTPYEPTRLEGHGPHVLHEDETYVISLNATTLPTAAFRSARGLLWGEIFRVDVQIEFLNAGDYGSEEAWEYYEQHDIGESPIDYLTLTLTTRSYVLRSHADDQEPELKSGNRVTYYFQVNDSRLTTEGHPLSFEITHAPPAHLMDEPVDVNIWIFSNRYGFFTNLRLYTVSINEFPVNISDPFAGQIPDSSYEDFMQGQVAFIGGETHFWFTMWSNQTRSVNVTQTHDKWLDPQGRTPSWFRLDPGTQVEITYHRPEDPERPGAPDFLVDLIHPSSTSEENNNSTFIGKVMNNSLVSTSHRIPFTKNDDTEILETNDSRNSSRQEDVVQFVVWGHVHPDSVRIHDYENPDLIALIILLGFLYLFSVAPFLFVAGILVGVVVLSSRMIRRPPRLGKSHRLEDEKMAKNRP